MDLILALAVFGLLALSSKSIGAAFSRIRMPQITGFLFTGIIAGPYVLEVISEEAISQIGFLDEVALGFIAFAAGSEMVVNELKSRFKSIRWVVCGLVLFTFSICAYTLFSCSQYVPFMEDKDFNTQLGIALLAGAILVARSPSSAIAVVNEVRARGPFTRTALGVTVIMDVVVILIFAINTSVADMLFNGTPFSPMVIVTVIGEILVSIFFGFLLGKYFLPQIFKLAVSATSKAALFLAAGYGVFKLTAWIRHYTGEHYSHEVLLEPLLICMATTFVITNYTPHRASLEKVLNAVGPLIYVLFFTLAGASLKISVLANTWMMALVLFGVRIVAIFLGGLTGGTLAGDPMKHNKVAWMCYITQAGIGLGLAKEAAVEFPNLGTDFSTLIIAVIVINQILGPPMFKWVLSIVGEAHVGAGRKDLKGTPKAVIFGWDDQSAALAIQLDKHGWEVTIASLKAKDEKVLPTSSAPVIPMSEISLEELKRVGADEATTIVCLLDDNQNFEICEIAFEHFGTRNLVAQILERDNAERFDSLNVLIINPETAFIGLLDHFVRSPGATSLLLGLDESQDVEDFVITNPDLNDIALRDLRLPLDTLVLSVTRGGALIVSHGYTTLHVGDIVTVIGSPDSLKQVFLKLTG